MTKKNCRAWWIRSVQLNHSDSVFYRTWLNSKTFKPMTLFWARPFFLFFFVTSTTHATYARILWTHANHATHETTQPLYPRHPQNHATTLSTPPTNPRYPRYLEFKKFWLKDFVMFTPTVLRCIYYFISVNFDWLYWKWALKQVFFSFWFSVVSLLRFLVLWKIKKKSGKNKN